MKIRKSSNKGAVAICVMLVLITLLGTGCVVRPRKKKARNLMDDRKESVTSTVSSQIYQTNLDVADSRKSTTTCTLKQITQKTIYEQLTNNISKTEATLFETQNTKTETGIMVETCVTSANSQQEITEAFTEVTILQSSDETQKTPETTSSITETTTIVETIEVTTSNTTNYYDDEEPYNLFGDIVDPNNCITINGKSIRIVYKPAVQRNIDRYDVVQDTEIWSNSKDKFFFGHNYRSFSCLTKLKTGDVITLVNNGITSKYVVFRSERGKLTDNNRDIISYEDECYLVKTDFGCETIRLITCYGYTLDRWVVIGEKIE